MGIPLQYPTVEFVKTSMRRLYNVDLDDYRERMAYIQFDLSIDAYEEVNDHTVKANLLKPDVWNDVIELAENMVEETDLGTLVFGSAMNLLLFSPTYKSAAIKNLEDIIKSDKSRTYMFSVSTSALADEIKKWEDAADNLTFTRMVEPMRLFFRVDRMKGVEFSRDEVEVPISQDAISEIKELAERTRKRIIPAIRKI